MVHRILFRSLLVAAVMGLTACATSKTTSPSPVSDNIDWKHNVLAYKESLPPKHPDRIEHLLALPAHISEDIVHRFGHLPDNKAIEALASWLIDTSGKGLRYDISADLSPEDSFNQRTGNCLSFTILLVTLADVLNIDVKYNEVDVPEAWGSDGVNESVLYEHVNAVQISPLRKRIFDLAIGDYRYGYPQRLIEENVAVAKLFSNRSVSNLNRGDMESAFHNGKLAAAYAPSNSSIWGNLGVVYKRMGDDKKAEKAFLHSMQLDGFNIVSASNLERLYRSQNRHSRANKYSKLAQRARRNNPYYHFRKAESLFANNQVDSANKTLSVALRLHANDPRFFELQSKIDLRQKNVLAALQSLGQAYKVAQRLKEKNRYAAKFLKLERKGSYIPTRSERRNGQVLGTGRG